MSKASKWAAQQKRILAVKPPGFFSPLVDDARKLRASINDDGLCRIFLIGPPYEGVLLDPDQALALGSWLLTTFGDEV